MAMEGPAPRRSMRRAAEEALRKIQSVLAWEECPESSTHFQEVARALDEQFGSEVLCAEEAVEIEDDHDDPDDPDDPENPTSLQGVILSDEEEDDSSSDCDDFIDMDLEDYNEDEDWQPRKKRVTWGMVFGGDSLSDLEDDTVEPDEASTEAVAGRESTSDREPPSNSESPSDLQQAAPESEERRDGEVVLELNIFLKTEKE